MATEFSQNPFTTSALELGNFKTGYRAHCDAEH